MAYLGRDDLKQMGFASIGESVLLSDRASFYNCGNIAIGNHVRIDDFCVLAAGAAGIQIDDYIHIAVGATLIGAGKITLSDFSGLSSRVAVYSSSDDYSGEFMTNPLVPPEYTCVNAGDVFLGKHVIVGSGSVILPGVTLEEGVAVGALSLISKRCHAFGIYSGNPATRVADRKRRLLMHEARFMEALGLERLS